MNLYSDILNQTSSDLPEFKTGQDDSTGLAEPAHVILFNDNIHTFDDVITQLIKAIHCSPETAEAYAWEVHNKGKCSVFEGSMPECLKVSSILEEIALHTQIEM